MRFCSPAEFLKTENPRFPTQLYRITSPHMLKSMSTLPYLSRAPALSLSTRQIMLRSRILSRSCPKGSTTPLVSNRQKNESTTIFRISTHRDCQIDMGKSLWCKNTIKNTVYTVFIPETIWPSILRFHLQFFLWKTQKY